MIFFEGGFGRHFAHEDYKNVLTSQASYPANKYVRFEELPYTDKGSTIEFEYG